jgi:hypothetical protein
VFGVGDWLSRSAGSGFGRSGGDCKLCDVDLAFCFGKSGGVRAISCGLVSMSIHCSIISGVAFARDPNTR